MQLRTLQRLNVVSPLAKKTTTKLSKLNLKQDKENLDRKVIYSKHPAYQLIRASTPSLMEFKKFTSLLYKGLYYSVNNLKGPSQEYINKKKVKLPETTDSKKKFLVLDLDETLIHSIFTSQKTDVKFTYKNDQFKFNVRPHCYQFLANMSQHYSIYVFTAGTLDYAQPIINYLNQKKKTIQGFLHRKNCMQTQNGFFIKDLRIISNRELKDIVIVDNLAHSFGLQLSNGIPILQFLDNKEDKQLLGLQKLLTQVSTQDDVRDFLNKHLNIRDHLQKDQAIYFNVQEFIADKL